MKNRFCQFRTYGFYLLLLLSCLPKPKKAVFYDPQKNYIRVAAANIFSAEILWRLGKESRKKVIAVPAMIDNPLYSSFSGKWPKYLSRFHRSSEEILSFQPDLVILAPFNDYTFRTSLSQAGIDYVLLEPFKGFGSYIKNVQSIALAVKEKQGGEKILSSFTKRLDAVKRKAKKIRAKNHQVMSFQYGFTAGLDTAFHDAVTAAGLENVSAMKNIQGFKKISVEQLLIWEPDSIVISCGTLTCSQAKSRFLPSLGLKKIPSMIIALPSAVLGSVNENMLSISESLQKETAL